MARREPPSKRGVSFKTQRGDLSERLRIAVFCELGFSHGQRLLEGKELPLPRLFFAGPVKGCGGFKLLLAN